MYKNILCRKNGLVMQNHGLGIHSDKNTLKYLKTYSADLPNQPKYLEYLKKALIECPLSMDTAMILCRLRMPFCSLAKLLGLHPRSSQSLTPVIAHSLPHAWRLPAAACSAAAPRCLGAPRRRIM
jgi:hypothetical protein